MNQEEIHNFTTQLGSAYSNLIINKLRDTKGSPHKVKWSSQRHVCLQRPSGNEIKMLYRYYLKTSFLVAVIGTAWKAPKYGVFSGPNTGKYGPQKFPYLDTFHSVKKPEKTQHQKFPILWSKSRYFKGIHRETSYHTNVEERFVTIMSPKRCSSSVP